MERNHSSRRRAPKIDRIKIAVPLVLDAITETMLLHAEKYTSRLIITADIMQPGP